MSADALDDNFELDDGLVADDMSGEEEQAQAGPTKRNRVIDEEEEDDFVSGSDVEDVVDEATGEADQSPPAKRAKTKSTSTPSTKSQQGQAALSAEEKKRKRKEKQKEAKVRGLGHCKWNYVLLTVTCKCTPCFIG